jgi:two-component system sensor histidine kinase BaeS
LNLRLRFILSNVLPIFIILPLMGLLLIFTLERFVFVPQLSAEIQADFNLLSRFTHDNIDIFQSPGSAQAFVDRYASDAPWGLMVLDTKGVLLASSEPNDHARIGRRIEHARFREALEGENLLITDYNTGLDSESIEAWGAVEDSSGKLIGVLRIYQPLENLGEELMQLRSVVAVILVTGLILGALIGLGLAISMERPINKITAALQSMAWEAAPSPIQIEGPEEFHLLAAAFNHLTERIRELETTRKQLLANLVHELGRPLGALRSSVQALKQGADQDPELRAELLNGMDAQTHDLERLVEDLTHLYDSSVKRFELKREPVKMDSWLKDVLATWKVHAEQKSAHFKVRIEDLPVVWIDPTRLSQAVGNLLSNAIKFTPKGGDIYVRGKVEESQVSIQIEDSGPGLSEEDRKKLFTPFYRGRQANRFPQGMGLGLSIARDIVLSHQGVLEADSSLTSGSRFIIRIPLSKPDTPDSET